MVTVHLIDDKTSKILLKLGIYHLTLDPIIDALRIKYNVVIYNSATPFIDPKSRKIVYNFGAKKCNQHFGWNGRQIIETSNVWDSNIYEAKRRAIRAAARWILAHKCKKVSIKKRIKK